MLINHTRTTYGMISSCSIQLAQLKLDKDDDICNGAGFPAGCGAVVNKNAMIPNAGDSQSGTFSFSSGTTYPLILSAFDQHY